MRRPLLTVLLLAYNHEATAERAIMSVIKQKTNYDYEVWILEDCSTDGTLAICEKYAKMYPDRIKLIAQPRNTKMKHILWARKKITTKYFTTLECDDEWCDEGKIQEAISFLETHPEYVIFAHDTQYNDHSNKTKKSLVHDIHGIDDLSGKITFEDAPYIHNSARIYRKVIDFKKRPIMGDVYTYYAFLGEGPMHYCDKIMSIYNITGQGAWSHLSAGEQRKRTERANYKSNKLLGFRQDKFFTERAMNKNLLIKLKRTFGTRIGWRLYLITNKNT